MSVLFLPMFIFLEMMYYQNDETGVLRSPRNQNFLPCLIMVDMNSGHG